MYTSNHINLGIRMNVNQTPASVALPPEKDMGEDAGVGNRADMDALEEINFLFLPEIEARFFRCPASSLITIPAQTVFIKH
jgi:hypothetical protein